MIKFFPLPRPREILYSTLARCRTYLGLSNSTFSKGILGRPMAATIRHEKYLRAAADRLVGSKTANHLLTKHTLAPLTAPFEAAHRGRLRNRWMRFCPECVKEQRQLFGEAYWVRDWQIKEAHLCLKHGCPLIRTPIPAGTSRWGFVNLEQALHLPENAPERILPRDEEILSAAVKLLNASRMYRLTPNDWKTFYSTVLSTFSTEADGTLYLEIPES